MLSSQVQERLVKRGQDQPFTYCEAKQVSVCHLIVPVQTFAKRLGQGLPVGSDRLVVIARLVFQRVQHRCDLFHAHFAGFWPGQESEDAGFGEGAYCPLQAGRVESLLGRLVVDVSLVQQSQPHVYV